jgi:hypothetical protein
MRRRLLFAYKASELLNPALSVGGLLAPGGFGSNETGGVAKVQVPEGTGGVGATVGEKVGESVGVGVALGNGVPPGVGVGVAATSQQRQHGGVGVGLCPRSGRATSRASRAFFIVFLP